VELDLKSQMLCHAGWIFMNGEAHHADERGYALLRSLADERALPALTGLAPESVELLYQWYLDGYISPL
jgi:50S ribosomal protein L16 3-hydroxylase